MLKPVESSILTVGKPTPWPIYNASGGLLIAQGHVIASQRQLDRILEEGFYSTPSGRAKSDGKGAKNDGGVSTPFEEYGLLIRQTQNVLDLLQQGNPKSADGVERLIQRLKKVYAKDPDAFIALAHVYCAENTSYEQNLCYAIIATFATQQLAIPEQYSNSLIRASITANVGLLSVQQQLNKSSSHLSDAQHHIIQRHPTMACELLKKVGIDDRCCQSIVAKHHEKADGSGYPLGCKVDEIPVGATVLGAIEAYVAMISIRAYRTNFPPKLAIEKLFESYMDRDDKGGVVVRRMLEKITSYPPGSMVNLRNGEIAIITQRASPSGEPALKALGKEDRLYTGPMTRDPREPGNEIVEPMKLNGAIPISISKVWEV